MRMMTIGRAFTGITAGLIALFTATTPGADAAPQHRDDCRIVAKNDQNLCRRVQGQLPYAYATRGGNLVYVPSGRTLVREEVTHAGLTRPEMHDALVGYARDYALHATGARSVVVDTSSLRRAYGPSAFYVVGTAPGQVSVRH